MIQLVRTAVYALLRRLPVLGPILAREKRVQMLEAKTEFLLDEVSTLRQIVRHVAADKMKEITAQQTLDSFDYQWDAIPEGMAMLDNEAWRKNATRTICDLARKDPTWFAGKRVMDAGCGQGRWTYGFGQLGVGSCVSVDLSVRGLERTRAIAKEIGEHFAVEKRDLLEPLPFAAEFDLVWCFGVLHHTGDTYRGFGNLVPCVKPGGFLFLMLYGEPRRDNVADYRYHHEIFDLRRQTRQLSFARKVEFLRERVDPAELHGHFDAISPEINDLYRWDEIVSWLRASGFDDIQRTLPDHANHHLIAHKKG